MRSLEVRQILSGLVLGVVIFYALGSVLFGNQFAKLHLDVPIVNLPLFIGEVIFFVCLLAFVVLFDWSTIRNYMLWVALASYIVVMIFFAQGPSFGLSLRNAALYYYPFFCLFVVMALEQLKSRRLIKLELLFGLVLPLFLIMSFDSYFRYSLMMIEVCLILRMKGDRKKIIAFVMLMVIGQPWNIFSGARTGLLSSLAALFFLMCCYWTIGGGSTRIKKISAMGLFVVLVVVLVWFRSDHNGIISLLHPKVIVDKYRELDQKIKASQYSPQQINIMLYNPKKSSLSPENSNGKALIFARPVLHQFKKDQTEVDPKSNVSLIQGLDSSHSEKSATIQVEGDEKFRDLTIAHNNILFRVFVWRDMFQELRARNAWIFGVGFWHPQRSASLETLGWAETEWSRDGWITPHNLFLHMIYRCGLVGLAIIVLFCAWFFGAVRIFLKTKSMEGLVLASAVVYWLVASQMLVILELPYYAIPFWFIVGLMWYSQRKIELNPAVTPQRRKSAPSDDRYPLW